MAITVSQILLLLLYVAVMSGAQVALKYLSTQLGSSVTLASAVVDLPWHAWFWIAGMLYFAAAVMWVWLLTHVRLSVAYPFVFLSLVIVPMASWYYFGEPLVAKYWLGVALIVAGITVLVRTMKTT